ncbi:MAG TPA: TonB-dependent receptor [Lunatimonas sp.]|nr:TonB-dependent receptor [Lunatimonas sp.]
MKNFLFIILPLVLLIGEAFSQEVVSGEVRDSDGDPVVGATVLVKGSSVFALSDENGKFSIQVSQGFPVTLQVNSVGFDQRESIIRTKPTSPIQIELQLDDMLSEIVITARRKKEEPQNVPIPISVIGGALVEEAGAFNVNRLKELVPSVQLYSSNPRNTTLNIRGLGSTFGLTNDGIDPGVGFYVDGVYFARPAVTTLDFIDIEQIEVLRGPQGTLFGKNTTSGAFNITTRKPSFTPGASFEASFGNFGFIQAKSSFTGPISKKLAGRFSFSGTQRDGVLYNVRTEKNVNDLNNLGFRTQLLYNPTEKVEILLAGDVSTQRPDGYAQVIAGVAPTLRQEYRQFNSIISDLNYALPTQNAFDRIIDHDTPWRSGNELGGVSLNVDIEIGSGTLTSTTAWRYWNWDPSNDRDFTGLQGLTLSQAPSRHDQWSQEIRYAGSFSSKLSGLIGVFALGQDLKSSPYHTEEAGRDQWRFSQNSTSPLWQTPGLLDGFGTRTRNRLESFSGAVFGQLDWEINEKIRLLPGLRYNYDQKAVDFNREVYGGLQTDDPALLALKNSVYNAQEFSAEVDESNFSGQLTVTYKPSEKIHTFATYSLSFKPVGINLGGLPRAGGDTMLELARINPELVSHYELGIKTKPNPRSSLNVILHRSDIQDYQTLVQTPDLSVNRGYLANAEKVRVQGAEVDYNLRVSRQLSVYGALAYTDGIYVTFTNAPPPLEEMGGETFKDISGGQLPGISKWAGSLGGELTSKDLNFLDQKGMLFFALENFYRSSFSSSPSPSRYLNVEGYTLINARAGFRAADGLSVFVWSRNLLNVDYFEQLLPGAGSVGHYAGVLGDPRTYGVTLRHVF